MSVLVGAVVAGVKAGKIMYNFAHAVEDYQNCNDDVCKREVLKRGVVNVAVPLAVNVIPFGDMLKPTPLPPDIILP